MLGQQAAAPCPSTYMRGADMPSLVAAAGAQADKTWSPSAWLGSTWAKASVPWVL